MKRLGGFWLATALLACRHPAPATPAADDGGADGPSAEQDRAKEPGATTVSTAPARRCGECHGTLEEQWRDSAHARAEHSPAYVAMRSHVQDDACASCHAPIAKFVDADSPLRGEGVTCDACHAMREAHAERAGGAYELALTDNTKYGPICDAKNHYFHKVGCSPMHGESRQCGSCHLLWKTTPGGSIPVFTEYEEWAASNAGAIGVVCQDCHMPGSTGEVAVGAGKRPAMSHHGFMGAAGKDLHAIAWTIDVSAAGPKVHAAVTLKNEGAGHSMPTGMPGRRLTLRARVVGADAGAGARDERTYARVLVDSSGAEVPFYEAVREASDNRIEAGSSREETFDLDAPTAGTLELSLIRTSLALPVARALGLPDPREDVVLIAQIPFGPPRPGGGRAHLPRALIARPSPN